MRRAWLTHVHAEEVLFEPFTEDEFKTQMEVMLGVFTDDCVMELVPAGMRWQGHAQATEFYRIFLGSFEGMKWVPQALVIGPQGVLDVVNMTGKLLKEFAGLDQVGAQVHLQWVIYFPWVPDQGKFKGEVIYRSANCTTTTRRASPSLGLIPPSSRRTMAAPATIACSLPNATSRGRYLSPQSGATISRSGAT